MKIKKKGNITDSLLFFCLDPSANFGQIHALLGAMYIAHIALTI